MKYRMKFGLILIFVGLMGGMTFAQTDYTAQVKALKASFDQKKPGPIKEFVSEELSFASYPAGATMQILGQVFNNLPKLNSLEILSQKKGEASVAYNFTALGLRESKLFFNDDGKIIELQLIDNLLKEQAEAQAALARQKQAPTPGPLAVKYPAKKVTFMAKDGLEVIGSLYEVGSDKPVILLCHQAGYNKYEYADIAPKLNEMGYNVLAIDQRSGGTFAEKDNETFKNASTKGVGTEFLDAEQDINAAVDYLYNRFNEKVILWGSSYSSSLALFIGKESDKVKAIISFSPGDYFGNAKASLSTVFQVLDKPFWVTSSKEEATTLSALVKSATLSKNQSQFIPKQDGYHGSRALWEGQEGGEEYWASLTNFLKGVKH